MDSRIRYEVLPTDDSDEVSATAVGASAAVPSEISAESSPEPAASAASETQEATANENTEDAGDTSTVPLIPQPPPYNIAIDLPTYEEAERTKAEEADRAQQRAEESRSNTTIFSRWMPNANSQEGPDSQLGTDGMFLCTFLMAFVFNWIGLLTSLCITQTVAGRLGAMSGFGLSLVKWVAIVKHSNWAGDVAAGDSLLWWLLILLGFLIFFRGATQYIRIKFHWHRLNQNARNNIFYYF